MNRIIATLLLLLTAFAAFSQSVPVLDGETWIKDISESKVFIENKGQFHKYKSIQNSAVVYGTEDKGIEIYFTSKGLFYRYVRVERERKAEEREREKEREREREAGKITAKEESEYRRKKQKEFEANERKIVKEYFAGIEWIGANPQVQIKAIEEVPAYFVYSSLEHPEHAVEYARGFKKITYQNLYPGIDVEYIFHPVEGIKYNLLVHAGADVSKVRMKYSGAGKLFQDAVGNVHLRLKDFEITDHAPKTFYSESNTAIASSFNIQKKTVAFELEDYDTSKAIVIDPWTTTVTTLVNNNRAFDIGKDAAGNVYIGGGRGNGTGYKVAKYSPAGALVWTNNTGLTGYWGDMATDPAGNCYVSEGSFVGNIIKVNSAGTIAWTSNIPNAGNGYEAWALAINDCNPNQLVVTWYDGSYNVRLANLNMATGATSGAQNMGLTQPKEIRALCIAPNGDVHGLTCAVVGGGTGGNYIFGGSSGFTQNYLIQSGYAWDEVSPLYSAANVYTGCGFNAIVADNCNVFTTNGVTLHKRNRTNGAIISSVAVPGGIFERNGGIAVDSCGNVYVGSQAGVYKFSNALVQTGFSATPAAVYDVRLSSAAGEVLACGDGFVASLAMTACSAFLCNNTIAVSVTPPAPVVCKDSSVTLTASGAATYTWSPAAGLSSTTGTTVTATPATTTTYTVIGSSTNGCVTLTDTTTVTVTINSPLANITSYTNASCGANNGTATVIATGGNGSYSYLWATGQTTAAINNLQPGVYVVTVTSGACADTAGVLIGNSSGLNITMLPPTQATCGQSNGAASVNVTSGNGPYTYVWSNGGSTSAISNLSAGAYSVTVTDTGGCSASASVTINSTSSITLTPAVTHTTCGDSNGSITVTTSGGTLPFSYQWSNGASTQTISNLPSGNYTVTVSDLNGCSATLSNQVNASTAVVVSINSSATSVCPGDSVQLCSSAPFASYAWNTAQTSSCIYATQGGTYNLTVTDASGCTGTNTVNVTALNAPVVNITGSLSYCAGNNVTITANGGVSYLWSNATTTASVTVTQGSYSVTATDANGCTAAASAVVTENAAPAATISGSVTYCTGGSTTLTASGGVSYLWSNAATTAAVTVTQGNYSVTVTDAGSCTASASVTVTASSSLTINITGALNYCPGSNTTISTSGGNAYLWNDAANSTTASITVTQGSYSVTVTDASGCTGTNTVNVTALNAPVVNITGSLSYCAGNNVSITANGGASYLWSNADTTASVTVTQGSYSVTATDANGCTAAASTVVTENAAPAATISGSVTYCTGGSTTLTASGGVSYLWSNATTTAAVIVTQGNYTVTVTDAGSCTASASVTVTASSSLTINITGALNYCPGSNTTISASGGNAYLWNDAANSTAPSITVTQGTYSVSVTDASGCTGSASANVTEFAVAPVKLGSNIITCKDSVVNIDAGNSYTAYVWSSGETSPIIQPQTSGNYTVTATVANGCTVSGSVNVLFNECADGEGSIYIPNAFTPNGDGNNDLFLVMGKNVRDIDITIFNRWGELVYSSQNLFAGWDGTYKKTALPPAVYVFVVKVTFINGASRDYKGSVTLIR